MAKTSNGKNNVGGRNKDKILSVLLALLNNQGIEEPTKDSVKKLTGISAGTWPSLISRMAKNDGTIAHGAEAGTLKLTAKGKDIAANPSPPEELPTTNAKVHEKIKQGLKGKALQIFEHIEDGQEHEKKDVMKAVKCTNPNTFAPLVSRQLKAKGLVEYPSRTTIRLTKEMCFPHDESV